MILQYLAVGVAAFGVVLASLSKGASARLYYTFAISAAACLPISALANQGFTVVAAVLLAINFIFMLLTSSGKI